MAYPKKMWIVGKFVGQYGIEKVSDTMHKRLIAIDTEEQFNNIRVFELVKTSTRDNLQLCAGLVKGDEIMVNFDFASRRGEKGWFQSVTAWSVKKYTPQNAEDFGPSEPYPVSSDAPTAPPVSEAENEPLPF